VRGTISFNRLVCGKRSGCHGGLALALVSHRTTVVSPDRNRALRTLSLVINTGYTYLMYRLTLAEMKYRTEEDNNGK
jgi:hypothetical protein